MADETPAAEGAVTEPQNGDTATTDTPGDGDLPEAVREILAKERKAAREAQRTQKQLEARLKAFEDRDKTEQQRADEARQDAERERDEARQEAARMRVALKHQLKPEDAELLVGDEDRMEALAQRLAAAAQDTPPSFDGGPRGPSTETNANDWIRRQISTAGR